MAVSKSLKAPGALQRRLLSDIADLQQNPYPNTHLHFDDADIRMACLVLTPEFDDPLHLTIKFEHDYPLRAPNVTIQTRIDHPNVFGDYICASILNTDEGWTPAYTLQGIVIQLLSFFCSDSLEQWGDHTVNLAQYRQASASARGRSGHQYLTADEFTCTRCGFGPEWVPSHDKEMSSIDNSVASDGPRSIKHATSIKPGCSMFDLPDEIVLLLLNKLQTRDVLSLADAIPTIKSMVFSYDFIRTRELQCFCLKQSYMDAKLGIGVEIIKRRKPVFLSEFDLLSQEAFFQHDVRRSVQGVRFDKWLPLPLSRRHWKRVQTHVMPCLDGIYTSSGLHQTSRIGPIDVLYHFMNNIVVQFSTDCEKVFGSSKSNSTLNHASEKAIESYFALFHLLLCIATNDCSIITTAERMIARFISGPRTKKDFPDLGHVLVAALISDAGLTEELTFLVIKEAILRNVVWALDTQGAGYAELAYLEPSSVSDYRLTMTFHASRTSYRLLMFLKLFSSAARPAGKSLVELRESLFDTHGGPPPGTSTQMANNIRKIHEISSFPAFLMAMNIKNLPSKSEFTSFLRRSITDSVKAGYSVMPLTQSQLYMIRKTRERGVGKAGGVEITPGMVKWFDAGEKWYNNGWNGRPSFFPGKASGSRGGDSGGGRGARQGRRR